MLAMPACGILILGSRFLIYEKYIKRCSPSRRSVNTRYYTMANRFDLLFTDEDGSAPIAKAPVAAPKKAVATEAKAAPAKGRMEGASQGKDARPQSANKGVNRTSTPVTLNAKGEEVALPDRPDRGAAMRGGRHAAPSGPRSMDRHSRDGRKHEGEKRQYAGKGNWGKPIDAEAVAVEGEAAPAVEGEAAAVDDDVVVIEEPVAPVMTLAQFMAEQEKKKPTVALSAVRKVEGVKGEVLKKTDDVFFQTAKPAPAAAAKKVEKKGAPAAAAPAKLTLQELNKIIPGGIARPPREEREPREEKGGKFAGKNGFKKPAAASSAPAKKTFINVTDAKAFPTL